MLLVVKGLLAGYIMITMTVNLQVIPMNLISLLVMVALAIAVELIKQPRTKYLCLTQAFIVLISHFCTGISYLLLLVMIIDTVYYCFQYRLNIAVACTVTAIVVLSNQLSINEYCILVIVAFIAYNLQKQKNEALSYQLSLDNERRALYNLEQTKNRLILANNEIESLTQERERNRIARDLHDTIGHQLAGVHIQLQAANTIFKKDPDKAKVMIERNVKHLQEAIQLLRDTVHQMHSPKALGIQNIQQIIEAYQYCNVSLTVGKEVELKDEKVIEILEYVIKEALTNVAKHSYASQVWIDLSMQVNDMVVSIKDNGIGCMNIKENLGFKSIRHRIYQLNGSVEINSEDGMHVVCYIPKSS